MSINYGGYLSGIMKADDANWRDKKRRRDEERYAKNEKRLDERWALTQEQFAFTKDSAAEQKRIKLLEMAIKYATKHVDSFTPGDYNTVKHSIAQLEALDIPDNVIAKISSVGAEGLAKIVTAFNAASEKHLKEYGEGSPIPIEMFVEALKNAVITQTEGHKIDVNAVLKQFDITANQAERLMIPTSVPSRIEVNFKPGDLTIVPALDFKDLPAALKAISIGVIKTAQEELAKYQKTIGQFPSGDTDVNKWLVARVGQIQSGISNATGDIPILTDLFGLFGNSYASQYIEFEPILNNAAKMGHPLLSSYAEAAARPDIDLTVPIVGIGNLREHGAKIYNYLMQNRLVPIVTRIKFVKTNGTEYNHLVTEESLEEFNG